MTNKTPVGFVGGVHDQDDLVYLKHRYYNPIVGRFYQPDPVTYSASGKLGQIHRYQYGWNDPFAFQDSSGLSPTQVLARTASGWGAVALEPSPFGEAVMAVATIGLLGYDLYINLSLNLKSMLLRWE